MADLGFQIVVAGFGANLDFLDLDGALLFFGFLLLFGLFVLEPTVIHDLADRWIGVGRNLHQIQAMLSSRRQGPCEGNDADLTAFRVDQPNFLGPDVSIDPGLVRTRWNDVSQKSYSCTSWR
jgi:hypothetical protein